MRHTITTFMLVGAVAAAAAASASTSNDPRAQVAQQRPTTPTASHAVRGLVKSVGATSLVITRSSRNRSDLVFVLNPSTLRDGTIAAGSTVSVRYRADGNTLLATAVTARVANHASRTSPDAR